MATDNNGKQIRIEYFAILREERGCADEEIRTNAATPRDLYDELRARHGFSLEADQLRVVINDAFCEWDAVLKEGDAIVFIPPVAGG